jgi:hypothetical protein
MTIAIKTRGRGASSPNALTPLQVSLLELIRKKGSITKSLLIKEGWAESTANKELDVLVEKGFLENSDKGFRLTVKADEVKDYHLLRMVETLKIRDRTIKTVNLGGGIAECRVENQSTGPLMKGTPNRYFPGSSPYHVYIRPTVGSPVVKIESGTTPSRPCRAAQ